MDHRQDRQVSRLHVRSSTDRRRNWTKAVGGEDHYFAGGGWLCPAWVKARRPEKAPIDVCGHYVGPGPEDEEGRRVLQRLGCERGAGHPTSRHRHLRRPWRKIRRRQYVHLTRTDIINKSVLAVHCDAGSIQLWRRSEEHTSELQSLRHLVCR